MDLLSLQVIFSLITFSFAYDLGVKHIYQYETSVEINEECEGALKDNPTGHSLKAKIELTNVWQDPQNSEQKLMRLQVVQPKLIVSKKSGYEEVKSSIQKISSSDSFYLFEENKVKKVWDGPNEHIVLKNLKRSIVSLLQVRKKDGEDKMTDVSGECDVYFKTEGNMVRKSIRRCHHPVEDTVLSQPSGVRSSSVRRSAGVDCELKDDVSGTISKCMVTEHVKTYSNLWKKASICVKSTSLFTLESTSDTKDVFKYSDYNKVLEELKKKGELTEGTLMAVFENKAEHAVLNVLETVTNFKESLKDSNLAKLKSASAFFKLLPAFRSATKDDILKVLENKKFEPILPQILDLVAASSTPSSLNAAFTFFGKVKGYNENLERFLISLSVLPSVESFVLDEIKTFLKKENHNEKIEATLITTLGALLRTYSRSEKAETKVVEDILKYLEDSLKTCKNDGCILNLLRGLRNAAQPKSVPLLLEYALKGGTFSLDALAAVKRMPTFQLSEESQRSLQKIFMQVGKKQDRSSRAIAAEILLIRNPTDEIVRAVLASLSDQSDEEFSTFVVSKILRLMEENEDLRSRILKVLSEKDVAHYYSLSQKGKSSLLKSELMSTDGLNATYGIEMELLQGGLLKRSAFDVELKTDNGVSHLLSVGMFAQGLASFAGKASSTDEGDPTAGMELTLLGVSLRPYVFFTSTSDLMSHALSGTASSPTPALQGIFSLSDDVHLIVLHNGMVARLELRGSMSADLSASIQISLWYSNSQSQVKNAAALLVKGAAIVDADFATTRGEYLYYGHSAIEFSTDLDFSNSPFKMCMQMEHPNVVLRHDFQRSVEVAETKFSLKKTKKRKKFIQSRSYALHQNNNELCRIMKGSDDY